MSLHGFLTRLILLCVLPLVLLAAYLAIDSVRTTRSETNLEAANLAKNFVTAIDNNLNARIAALQMLTLSPLADRASRRKEFYQEAQGFRAGFGSHVILADLQMRMLFNTRVPFGTLLPALPRPRGRAAAPIALETGKPAVGDTFFGPIANELLVAIAVPGLREGRTAFLLLTVFESHQFQNRLAQVALPPGWSLALIDGNGEAIARRGPQGLNPATDVDASGRFVAESAVSPWSVVLEIPRDLYRAPLVMAAAILAIALLCATLTGILGGMLASRRLGKSVASLAQMPAPAAPVPDIAEIAAARRLLDESAQKRATDEAEIRRLNTELELRVAERTAELTASNRDLDSFAYSVSHDLRAPLRSIDGFANVIEEDYGARFDAEGRDALRRVRGAARRMGELIDDLLKLSRVTRSEMNTETVDLSALARPVADQLRATEPERNVAFEIPPTLEVRGDRRLLEVVLENMLGNAWKFTGKHASARIELGIVERDGKPVCFVRDDGAGFDMTYAVNLFTPFQRLHNASDFPGTGIGLATVRRIVQRHGGRVWAEGAIGQGATFYFTLSA